jgi:hypothetical protein
MLQEVPPLFPGKSTCAVAARVGRVQGKNAERNGGQSRDQLGLERGAQSRLGDIVITSADLRTFYSEFDCSRAYLGKSTVKKNGSQYF